MIHNNPTEGNDHVTETKDRPPLVVRKMTPAARERASARAVRLYAKGESVRSIAGKLGVSYGTAHRWLSLAGTDMRQRGGPNRKPVVHDRAGI